MQSYQYVIWQKIFNINFGLYWGCRDVWYDDGTGILSILLCRKKSLSIAILHVSVAQYLTAIVRRFLYLCIFPNLSTYSENPQYSTINGLDCGKAIVLYVCLCVTYLRSFPLQSCSADIENVRILCFGCSYWTLKSLNKN